MKKIMQPPFFNDIFFPQLFYSYQFATFTSNSSLHSLFLYRLLSPRGCITMISFRLHLSSRGCPSPRCPWGPLSNPKLEGSHGECGYRFGLSGLYVICLISIVADPDNFAQDPDPA